LIAVVFPPQKEQADEQTDHRFPVPLGVNVPDRDYQTPTRTDSPAVFFNPSLIMPSSDSKQPVKTAILVTRQITFPMIYVLDENETHLVVTERLDADEAIEVPKDQIVSITYNP